MVTFVCVYIYLYSFFFFRFCHINGQTERDTSRPFGNKCWPSTLNTHTDTLWTVLASRVCWTKSKMFSVELFSFYSFLLLFSSAPRQPWMLVFFSAGSSDTLKTSWWSLQFLRHYTCSYDDLTQYVIKGISSD